MTLKEAYEEGKDNGHDIARNNVCDFVVKHYGLKKYEKGVKLLGDRRRKFVCECLDIESDHFRQYSPFEFFAKEINDMDEKQEGLSDVAWERYESGVLVGINKAIAEYNKP